MKDVSKRGFTRILFGSVITVLISATLLIASGNLSSAASFKPFTITGEWKASVYQGKGDHIQLSFTRRSTNGDFNNMGESFAASELKGLSVDARSAVRTDVKFSVERDAGTLICEGYFEQGRGAGTWSFSGNSSFVSAMSSRGFGQLTEEDLLRAAFHDIKIKYADDLRSAGFNKLDFEQLIRASNHDITGAYAREMQAAGFTGLTMEDLIRASNHDIDGAYLGQMRALGFDKQDLESVIRLKNHDITAEFVNEMRSVGFDKLTPDDLIKLENHDVTAEFIKSIKAEGYSDISTDAAIKLKNHDVDADFIRKAKAQGYPNATLDDLIRLSSRGTIK